MKWFVVVLVCLVGYGEGGAMKYKPGEQDSSCIEHEKESPVQIAQVIECQTGSQWESNCHSCGCFFGVAKCKIMESCDKEYAEPMRCKPNTDFAHDCNWCTCTDNGMLLCTLAECNKLPILKASEGKTCAPGSHWMNQCNNCSCIDGRSFCSKKYCGEDNVYQKTCAPESRWTDGCNNCWCTSNGDPICTRRTCVNDDLGLNVDAKNENELRKTDSSLVLRNPFIIQKHGNDNQPPKYKHTKETYTEIEEHNPIFEENYDFEDHYIDDHDFNHLEAAEQDDVKLEEEHNVLKRSVCKPSQEFQSECNQCKCAADGQSYTCTQNECMDGDKNKEVEVFIENEGVDHIEQHSVCKPRSTFYIGCNTCHCNPYGTDYSCTNKPCPLPEDVEIFHELKTQLDMFYHTFISNPSFKATKSPTNVTKKIVCVANRMFIKDCNTCWCNEDGTSFFCTRKVCVPEFPDEDGTGEVKLEELRIIERECRPDEVFELDCNMCRCNPDGKSFSCTRRACIEPVDELVKKSTLSRKTRNSKNEQAGSKKNCLPNQEFRMDCNKCLCDPAGLDFSCTRIDCYQLNNNNQAETRTRREATSPDQECVPGTKFKMGCNTCQCSLDGKVAMCSVANRNRIKRETGPPPADDSKNSQSEQLPETSIGEKKEQTSEVKVEAKSVVTTSTESDPNFRCNPGEQFKRGCNDCSCSADGKSFFCTVRFCDQDITPPTSR
ncbi:uncharacterized protein LOC113239760 [Hyposmocoma kahamanoa]|uniref:uncharacterized protein LOC113239760 n=1 Tax=Hyposmocoma kahamanoa TaxID=1477025 RepID=UPI000E6D5D6E|nr:uncharacterized protein LOC113239760 [Hyposmocoma kahamanoa]